MSLPTPGNPYQVVEIAGEEFKLRSLTRAEVALFQKQVAEDRWSMAELEIAVIAAATGTPKDEAKAWYESEGTPAHVAEHLMEKIREISRMYEGAQKSD